MYIVNAINLSSGGGFSILKNVYLYAPLNSIFLIKDEGVREKLLNIREDGPKLHIPHKWIMNPIGFYYYYYHWVNNFCKKNEAQLLISLGNIASKTMVNQKLYLHWPYFIYGVSEKSSSSYSIYLKRILRYITISFFSRYTNEWIVQTNVMKGLLHKNKGVVKECISQVYPGYTAHTPESIRLNSYRGKIELIFPSLFYSHKNFEILQSFFLDEQLTENIYLSLTLPSDVFESLGFKECLNVRNLGVLTHEQVLIAYGNHDALIMPTLLETFGLPYLEAMSLGLPVLTSDKDFSREICEDYAFYFDPHSTDSLADSLNCLKNALKNNYDFKSASKKPLLKFSSWEKSVNEIFK